MAKSSWQLESNRIAVQERMARAVQKAANTVGRRAEERAVDTVHVITGRLKSTITHEVIPEILLLSAGGIAEDGFDVQYASYEEARHPFLWPAWESVQDNFKGEILIEFGKGGVEVVTDTFPQAIKLIRTVMLADSDIVGIAPGGIFGGKADQEQMSAGAIAISMAGYWKPEIFQQLTHPRIAIHCFSYSDDNSERMSGVVTHKLNYLNRQLVTQPDTGLTYILHLVFVSGGPLAYQENTITSATTLYINSTVGIEPV